MFRTGPAYTGFSSLLTECLLNKTVTEGTTKKIDEATLVVALAISKARYADMKTRFKINAADKNISREDAEKVSVLDGRIKNYTGNLEDIFKKLGLSSKEGSDLLFKMQDQGGKDV